MADPGKLCLDGSNLDSTDTLTGLHANLDIALVTPLGAPGVLYKEVLKTTLGTVAYHEGSVVNVMTATLVSDYTTSVLHEHKVVSLKGHSDGSFLNSTSQLLRVHRRHINEVSNTNCLLGPVGLAAFTSETLVGVVKLHHDSVVLCVPESTVHSTAKAALVSVDLSAVNKLLLT